MDVISVITYAVFLLKRKFFFSNLSDNDSLIMCKIINSIYNVNIMIVMLAIV